MDKIAVARVDDRWTKVAPGGTGTQFYMPWGYLEYYLKTGKVDPSQQLHANEFVEKFEIDEYGIKVIIGTKS